MIKFLITLFLFLPLLSISQTTLNLNNSLSGISSQILRGTNTLNYRSRDAFKLLQNTTLGISFKLSKTKD